MKITMQQWSGFFLFLFVMTAGMMGWVPAHGHTFRWTPPTYYVNNDLIEDGELDEYRLYCESFDGAVTTFPGDTTTGSFPFEEGSQQTCFLTAVDITGDESEASNSVNFTEDRLVPNAPVLEE